MLLLPEITAVARPTLVKAATREEKYEYYWGDENVDALTNFAGSGISGYLELIELFVINSEAVISSVVKAVENAVGKVVDQAIFPEINTRAKKLAFSEAELNLLKESVAPVSKLLEAMSPARKKEFLLLFGDAVIEGRSSVIIKMFTGIWPYVTGEKGKIIPSNSAHIYTILLGNEKSVMVSYHDGSRVWECDCHEVSRPCVHILAVRIKRKAA